MLFKLKKSKKYSFLEEGEGQPIVLLHGLMGELSNFSSLTDYFSQRGFKIYAPELPLYSLDPKNSTVAGAAKFTVKFIKDIVKEPVILVGNSLGGHIGLITSLDHPEWVKALCLTGSSGLYERSFGDSYPKVGTYEYIQRKTEEVFYDPKVATKQVVDDVFNTLNDRKRAMKTLYFARSAIKHNMKDDLKNIHVNTCLIWGKQDNVTPPEVANEFNETLPNSELFWIDKCGHAPMMEHPDEFNQILHKWLLEKNIAPAQE